MLHWTGNTSIKYFVCRAKGNPSLGMVEKLMNIFNQHGHHILGTSGFKIDPILGVKRTCNSTIHNKIPVKVLRSFVNPRDMD